MVKFCHSSKRRVRNDKKLLDCTMPNDDGIPLLHGKSRTTLIYDGQLDDDEEIPWLRNNSSPKGLEARRRRRYQQRMHTIGACHVQNRQKLTLE